MTQNEAWWIADEQLNRGGKKILGPFESRDLALEVRTLLEHVRRPQTFWVDSEPYQPSPDSEPRG
jgi:hypothetical protein